MRGETVILETPNGRFRLCNACFTLYEQKKANENFNEAKKKVELFGLGDKTDAYDIMDKKKKFIQELKEGKYGG